MKKMYEVILKFKVEDVKMNEFFDEIDKMIDVDSGVGLDSYEVFLDEEIVDNYEERMDWQVFDILEEQNVDEKDEDSIC